MRPLSPPPPHRTTIINRSHAVFTCVFLAFFGVSIIAPTPVMAQSCPALEARLEALEELTSRMQLVQIDGHWAYVFGLPDQGVNMYVQNGMGMTACANGLGNLIVGYNEGRTLAPDNRTGSHNLILGEMQNYTSYGGVVFGSTNSIEAPYSTILGGALNEATGYASSICGGAQGQASGSYATVSGGHANTASGYASVVSGGINNVATGDYSVISGASDGLAQGLQSVVLGRANNVASAENAAVCGGNLGHASGMFSVVSGGRGNEASALFGYQHNIIGGVMSLMTGRGHFSVNGAAVGTSIIGGIEHEIISASLNTIVGGAQHISAEGFCSLLGGYGNLCNSLHGQEVGGKHNRVDAEASTIGNGYYNEVSPTGIAATIIGGELNIAEGPQCSVFGGTEHHIYSDGVSSAISGGALGDIYKEYSSISGGIGHNIKGTFSSASGGQFVSFHLTSQYSASLGSSNSKINSYYDVLLGGDDHAINAYYGVIYGGYQNSANGDHSVIVNGNASVSRAKASVILGGGNPQSRNITGNSTNPNIGGISVILGGVGNNTTGNYCSLGGGNGRIQSVDYSYDF